MEYARVGFIGCGRFATTAIYLTGDSPEAAIADGYEAMRICRALVESGGRPRRVAEIQAPA